MSQNAPGKQMFKRIMIIMFAMIILTVSITGVRLFDIMVLHGEEYQSKASEQQLHDANITPERGKIYDTNMNVLATSASVWTVYVTPNDIASLKEDERTAVKKLISEGLAEILQLKVEDIAEKLDKTNRYYVELKRKCDDKTVEQVRKFLSDHKDKKLSNYIGIDEATTRYYPENIASTILGFVGDENKGLNGLELQYDSELTGVAGRVVSAKNANGADMPFSYEKIVDAQPGNSLVLTVDSYIQYVVEKYLSKAVTDNNVAERGACVVMNVKTGAILAMATKGDYDCNNPFVITKAEQTEVDGLTGEARTEKLAYYRNRQWRNKSISEAYEPGSVFKVITASIGVEEGVATESTSCNCPGYIVIAGQRYSCHKKIGHGTQNLSQATANSCNPFFINLGQLIGVNTFTKYFKAFGLTEKTGIDLPGEAGSQYHAASSMGPTELASESFGQTFKVTSIQLLTAISAAVNGGNLVQPHIVQKIIDQNNNIVSSAQTTAKRQVVSESTSKLVRKLMEGVVDGGGGQNAYVAGYRIGGKTGTSQKVNEMLSTGKSGLYIASFCGVAPIDDPEIAMIFLLDEPHGSSYYGGTISAPVGGQILSEILPYLGYQPNYANDELLKSIKTVPSVVGQTLDAAKSAISSLGLNYKIAGSGQKIVRQLPESGASVYHNGTVILYTDEKSEKLSTTVPTLTGMTLSQVNNLASQYGLNITFKGNTSSDKAVVSYQQSVAAGTVVEKGTVVDVFFRSNETGDIGG